MRNYPFRSQLALVAGGIVLLGWPLLFPGPALAQDTCRDTIFFLPCDYWARRSFDTSAIPSPGGGDTGSIPPGVLAPMSGLSGIWDGAQPEVVTPDSWGAGIAPAPGRRHGLAMDSKSRVYVVYCRYPNSTGGNLYFKFKDPGQLWQAEVAFPSSLTAPPHGGLAIPPRGDQPQFLYLEGGNYRPSCLVHAVYDFNAAMWTADTIVHCTREYWPYELRLDIAVDALGGFHVVWPDAGWNEELQKWVDQVVYAENTTGVWHTQVVANLGTAPLMELDSSGRALIAYIVRRDGHEYKIFAANRSRGDTVWTADSIDTAPGVYAITDMRLGRDGTLHVLFWGNDCEVCFFTNRLFYTKRAPGSRVFEPWHQLFDHAGPGVLMVDCSGHAHAWYRWYDEEEFRSTMYYATNASGTWVSQTSSFGSVPDYQVYETAMMLDRFDQARAVLSQRVEYQNWRILYYAAPTVYFDVIDVVRVVDHVYGGEAVCDPYTYDEDCSGAVDAADVIWIINYCFRNGPNGCRF